MKTKLIYLPVPLVALALSALAVDYSGTYQGDQLTMTLKASGGRYAGTIQMGQRKLPCTGREVDNRLQGTFESEGNQFPFTAALQGDNTLTLESGGTAYTLKKQTAAVNPLAQPMAANPLGKPAVVPAARAATNSAGILRFRKVSINDQPNMIGGEALSFLAPVDWQVEGGIVWRTHPTMPASVAMRVRNPKGLEQLENFPTLGFSWGGYLPVSGFPQGSMYMGNEVQPPVRDAIAYVKERLLPLARGNVQARIVKTEELPKLAEAARQAEAVPPFGGPQMIFTAGRVRIEYQVAGKAVEEDLYGVLNTMVLPTGNMTIQVADRLCGMRAPKGKLDQAAKVFETMIHSTRINLQWFSQYSQLVQALTQAQMNQIRAAGELSRYISRTSNEISDMMRQSYEQRQASQDRINQNWSQYMRGVDEYRDPVAGRPVELPSGYQNAWVNGSGEYIVTDSANFNPNVELDGNWQKLERKE
ncbi:MAG TPA: hypothetical protein P5205_20655 [Candidatus Paceibacterota bacterium]|nr:hypothetical protein [Verrucomicrobiota bacterium]HSA12776.1 hypothetical protein [Candidatus Paceibacterota bacterium]